MAAPGGASAAPLPDLRYSSAVTILFEPLNSLPCSRVHQPLPLPNRWLAPCDLQVADGIIISRGNLGLDFEPEVGLRQGLRGSTLCSGLLLALVCSSGL